MQKKSFDKLQAGKERGETFDMFCELGVCTLLACLPGGPGELRQESKGWVSNVI